MEPVFEVGQTLWRCMKSNEVCSFKIKKIDWIEPIVGHFGSWEGRNIYRGDDGRTYYEKEKGVSVFLTKEEAEAKAERNRQIETKRLMLLEEEERLNNILGIDNHFFVRKHKGE